MGMDFEEDIMQDIFGAVGIRHPVSDELIAWVLKVSQSCSLAMVVKLPPGSTESEASTRHSNPVNQH